MFGLLVLIFGVTVLVGFWSVVFAIVEFFKELKEKSGKEKSGKINSE
jgi:hypothetical protein